MARIGVCKVEGCDKTLIVAHGFCDPHYRRFKRHGDPLKGKTGQGKPLEWLQTNSTFGGPECLEWPYSKMRHGYGHLLYMGSFTPAHRLMCEMVHGAAPTPSHQAAHSCRNPPCCNPRHLRWATPQENTDDKVLHGTVRHGEACANTFLSRREVVAIRRLERSGVVQRRIAEAFGVSPQRVNEIVKRKAWKHV